MRSLFGFLAAFGLLSQAGFSQQCKNDVNSTARLVSHTTDQCPLTGKTVAVTTAAHQNESQTLVDIALSNKDFSTLVTALKAAGLVETLSGKGPFTVFAPTNEAFNKLPKETLQSLLKPENKEQLASILTYHVVPSKVMSSEVVKVNTAKTVQGQTIDIKVADGKVRLNGSSNVIKTDIVASNGVIHVIDSVILPTATTPKTVVEIAMGDKSFSTLVAAVKAAGLAETLMGDGPFTVFAPTNEAFAKLPKETLESLLKPENKEKLKSILLYHVVPGRVVASDVVDLKAAKSAQGQSIEIATANGKVSLNQSSNVIKTDIVGSNGVIHVIDTVILPPQG